MRLINRVVREEHVKTVIENLLYFAPCRTFVDLLEFRFGYCWDSFEIAQAKRQPEIFERCVQKTFSDAHVQKRIDETVISCWSYNQEKPYMWEVYGQSQAAIIVTVKEDELKTYITKHWGKDATACGVRYGFETDQIFPEFGTRPSDSQWDKDYDLFLHKHPFYRFEKEFRVVIFGQTKAVSLPLPNEMVTDITLSPLASLEPSLMANLKDQFGDRVRNSKLSW